MKKHSIDKYGIILNSHKKLSKGFYYNPHVNVYHSYGQLHITVTSKAVTIPNVLNGIEYEDIKKHPEIIFNSTGYEISYEDIMTSPLFWLDIKTDVINTTGYSNKEVISVLREKVYKNTTKYETPSFGKNKGFENSILVKSTCKTVKDSINVYDKIHEIISTRWIYPEYYKNFSDEFLTKNNNILRFERRLQSSKDIKKAFHLEYLKYVTLEDIYNSNIDVVADKVMQLFM